MENNETSSKKQVSNFTETFHNPCAALHLAKSRGWMPVVAEVCDESSCTMWPLYFHDSLVTGLEYITFMEEFYSCTNQKYMM